MNREPRPRGRRRRKRAGWAAILPIALLLAAASTAHAQRTLYVTAQWPAAGLYTLTIDLNTGGLTEVPSSAIAAGTTPSVPSVSPDGKLIFAPDFWTNNLFGYSIDASTGKPTALAGSPTATGAGPNAAIFKPDGSAIFVANYSDGNVSSAAVSPSGVLTAAPGSPFAAAGAPTTIATSPARSQLYVPGLTADAIGGYAAGAAGSLSALGGFPLTVTGAAPVDAEYAPSGNFLFVLNQTSDDITTYSVNQSTGALSEVGTRPSVSGTPAAIAASPNGQWLAAVSQTTDELTMFSLAGSGQLTQIGSPVSIGAADPYDIAFTPDSRFVYTSNYAVGGIAGFSIDQSSGAATAVPGSPFALLPGPAFSLAMSPDQGPTAAFSSSVTGATASFDAAASSDPDGSVATYAWDFGDGNTATTATAQTTHTYAADGDYTATLTVTDNENCSTTQIGTGQTINCNGSSAAQTAGSVSVNVAPPPAPPSPPIVVPITAPLILSKVSVKEERLRRGQTRRRVISRYTLNRKAGVTMRFQRVSRGRVVNGRCKAKTNSNARRRRCAYTRNYGGPVKLRGNPGSNRKTFVRTFGGRPITRGRFRQVISAADSKNVKSKTLTVGFRVQGP